MLNLGILKVRASQIDEEMKMAADYTIAFLMPLIRE